MRKAYFGGGNGLHRNNLSTFELELLDCQRSHHSQAFDLFGEGGGGGGGIKKSCQAVLIQQKGGRCAREDMRDHRTWVRPSGGSAIDASIRHRVIICEAAEEQANAVRREEEREGLGG